MSLQIPGDSLLRSGNGLLNNMKFTTTDHDRDEWPGNCATVYGGGWWYNGCFSGKLTGAMGGDVTDGQGVRWYNWPDNTDILQYVQMKIRVM